MKILVLSDSHRSLGAMLDAVDAEKPDAVIHLGDHITDAEELRYVYDKLPVCAVAGNCDYAPEAREELVTEYAGVRFFLTHGHRYGVKSGTEALRAAAVRCGAQVVLFGHTHIPFSEEQDGLWLMNPGACGYGRCSYGIVEVRDGRAFCRVVRPE